MNNNGKNTLPWLRGDSSCSNQVFNLDDLRVDEQWMCVSYDNKQNLMKQ